MTSANKGLSGSSGSSEPVGKVGTCGMGGWALCGDPHGFLGTEGDSVVTFATEISWGRLSWVPGVLLD